jgi:hypothetical protein
MMVRRDGNVGRAARLFHYAFLILHFSFYIVLIYRRGTPATGGTQSVTAGRAIESAVVCGVALPAWHAARATPRRAAPPRSTDRYAGSPIAFADIQATAAGVTITVIGAEVLPL